MQITLHRTGDLRMQASIGRTGQRPNWLGQGYHPLGNGFEFRLQPLSSLKTMLFVRPIGAKQAKSMAVPIVGYRMSFEFAVNERGEPVWAMQEIIERLLGKYGLPSTCIHLRAAGTSLILPAGRQLRTLQCSSAAIRRYNVTVEAGDLPVDRIDGASWAINTASGDTSGDGVSTNVYVWTDLPNTPDEQKQFWSALR